MAQRLVRKLCPDCRQEETLPPALLEKIAKELAGVPQEYLETFTKNPKFFHGKGCASCNNTGYSGRAVIAELLEIEQDLRDIISKENFDSQAIEAAFKKQKYVSLLQDGIVKAMSGLTSIDEIMRVMQT